MGQSADSSEGCVGVADSPPGQQFLEAPSLKLLCPRGATLSPDRSTHGV